jgi:nicotinate dehydrogenase subunit A
MPPACQQNQRLLRHLASARGQEYIGCPTCAKEETMAKSIGLNVNGKSREVRVDDPQMPLLYALRNDLDLHGPRFGCGLAQCGACTVHVDGKAVRSCRFPVAQAAGKKVVTLEGLGGGGKLHPLQQAFIQEQAVQCGYCINGMIMQAAELLAKNKRPGDDEIRQALANNLCRCGTHSRIIQAVKRASEMMA